VDGSNGGAGGRGSVVPWVMVVLLAVVVLVVVVVVVVRWYGRMAITKNGVVLRSDTGAAGEWRQRLYARGETGLILAVLKLDTSRLSFQWCPLSAGARSIGTGK
jgi:cell division protein FtsL